MVSLPLKRCSAPTKSASGRSRTNVAKAASISGWCWHSRFGFAILWRERQIAGLLTLENTIYVTGSAPTLIDCIIAVREIT